MRGIVRHRHAPAEARPRDGEVLEPAGDEADHLVAATLGADEIRVPAIEIEERRLPLGEPKEIARLLHPLHLGPGGRALPTVRSRGKLAFRIEGLVAHGIPARITAEIDLAGGLEAPPQLLAGADVARLRGPDEIVVREIHHSAEVAEVLRDPVAECSRLHSG